MESCQCPITQEIFEDPVMGDDGHTYERKAIIDWLIKNGTSPITRQPMNINTLRTNYMVKQMISELRTTSRSQQTQYQFQLDVNIRKTRQKPIFQGFGKTIYEVEWINRDGPPIILLKIGGAKANREASYYVQLSCHPYIVRTFGFVECNPGSIMLLQECAPHGDLSELLQENGFQPNEKVLLRIFEQICDAMICLADNGIVHGDLACRNVLVFQYNINNPDKNLVKLTDFGLTRGSKLYSIVDSFAMSTMTIIPIRYAAPEILRDLNKSNYSEKSDVYSMGVLMWEACSYGQLPYSSLHDDNDVRRRKLNDERLTQPTLCSLQLWNIMNDCWHSDPKNRPTFKTLKTLLLIVENQLSSTSQRHTNQNRSRLSVNEHHISNDMVFIPCELCNKQIDLRLWSIHNKDCRERETRRTEARAKKINRATATEKLPCEHCEELFSVQRLQTHEVFCQRNPENIARAGRPASSQPSATVVVSTKSSKTARDPTWSSTVQGRMRSNDNDVTAFITNGCTLSEQRRASYAPGSHMTSSSRDISGYNTLPLSANGTQSLPRRLRSAMLLDRTSLDRQLEDSQPMSRRTRSPSTHSSRSESASRSSRNDRGRLTATSARANNSLSDNNNINFHSPRDEDQTRRTKLNQRDRSATSNSKSKWKPSLLQPPMSFHLKKNEFEC